jgi:hypothetical protein
VECAAQPVALAHEIVVAAELRLDLLQSLLDGLDDVG